MNNDAPHNVRLVYYACAYLLAHRGHFLFNVDKNNIEKITDFKPIYDDFYSSLQDTDDNPPFDREAKANDIEEILKQHISSANKEKELKQRLFGGKIPKPDDSAPLTYNKLIKLISGGTVKLSELFGKECYKELEKNSVCVKNSDFDDTLEMLMGQIEETHLSLLASVKGLYDWSLLEDILSEDTAKYEVLGYEKSISLCKVAKYDRHNKDLAELKYFIRKYIKDKYSEIFRKISDKPNYVSYVYNAPSENDRNKYKKCLQEDFCKFLKPYLAKITPTDDDKERFEELKKKCEDNELCPKQVTTDNRVIPYQLYYAELKKILENACKYLPFLNEKDEYGTVAEKILSIMEFRVPYYAGPLITKIDKNKRSEHSWLVRKAEGKIYPWNFEDMVDEGASEDEFIRRMTCKCTYLAGADVLPKYSLLYSKFMVLNEINNIKVNGEPISVEAKKKLYHEKFVESKARVTKKRIKEFLLSIGEYSGDIEVSGIDDNIKSSLKPYHDFEYLMSSGQLAENDVERIIERITVTTDTKRLKDWLKKEYPAMSDEDIKYISKLKYKDYGRLSRRFLEEVFEIVTKTGETVSDKNIISALWETNDNLMQLLGSKYRYAETIENLNKKYYYQHADENTISKRMESMYLSPAVRRSVIRTLDIVKELKAILKKAPDKIFIEMARGAGETPKGKRTKSRREQITEFLDTSETDNIDELRNNLGKTDDGRLRSEKIYLYFMQLGRCAYTGKSISFDELNDNAKWNIDHIWPQAKIKDDSLDNKVLVDTNANGAKGDKYPISSEIRSKMSGFWHSLYKKNMMSEKKYQRLMRSTPFKEEELAGFIARQLVETRQSAKAAAAILKELFPESEIVYVKAGLVSEFRQEMDMLKCREINDLHHAKDAYLNIVMGNIYNTRFTSDPRNFIHKHLDNYSIKLTTLLSQRIERSSTIAWDPDASFDIVRKMMLKNSIRYVRYTYKRKGGLFNQMPERKKVGLVPRKSGKKANFQYLDTTKYGGYNNTTVSSFAVIKCKTDVIIIPVELMFYNQFFSDIDFARKYSYEKLKYILPDKKYKGITKEDIVLPTIGYQNNAGMQTAELKINSIVEVNCYPVSLCSKDSKGKYIIVASPVSLIVDKNSENYIKKIMGFFEKDPNRIITSYNNITKEQNLDIYDIIMHKCGEKPFNIWSKFADMADVLQKKRNIFFELSVEEQVKALKEIVSILKSGRSVFCNLSCLNESGQSCISKLGAVLTGNKKIKSVVIVDQSPTGLFEKKSVNLLEL